MRSRGFTLLEMITTVTVLLILASAVVPMARNGVTAPEGAGTAALPPGGAPGHRRLQDQVDQQKIKPPALENNGYPESLEILVEGAPMMGKTIKMRFLRRIPVDPFLGKAEWGLRSIADEPDSTSWGGGNVFDLYSLAPGTGMNGIPYREW